MGNAIPGNWRRIGTAGWRPARKRSCRLWRATGQEDQLFVLRQEQAGYEFCQKQITECDQQLAQYLARLEDRTQGATLPEETRKGRRKKKKGNPQFNLRQELFRMTGTDLTQIDGIDVMSAMTVVSEVGWDMSKWKTENHFVSWLKLSPDNSRCRSNERGYASKSLLNLCMFSSTQVSNVCMSANSCRHRVMWARLLGV